MNIEVLEQLETRQGESEETSTQSNVIGSNHVRTDSLSGDDKVSFNFQPVEPDEVISDVEIDDPPKLSFGNIFKDEKSNVKSKSDPLTFNKLILGSQLLRGTFNEDVFGEKIKDDPDKPAFEIIERDDSTVDEEASHLLSIDPQNDIKKLTPEEVKLLSTKTDFGRHKQKVQEIVDMIQKNKNSYYLNMVSQQPKHKNDMHAYLTHNKAHLAPFSYTKFKIPMTNEGSDLAPFTENKKLNPDKASPVVKKLGKEYKSLSKEKKKRKNKIQTLITERNDREYYLALNTNQFKVKMNHLKKMDSAVQNEIGSKIKSKKQQISLLKRQDRALKKRSASEQREGNNHLFSKGMTEEQFRDTMMSQNTIRSKKCDARQMLKD